MTGLQALARLPIEQLRADRLAGLSTAAFVSGYPGSPVGGYDGDLARAIEQAPDLPIVLAPALNEEQAATAVMGSQLASLRPDSRYDGVLGIFYCKAPGVDRAGDALRHAVFAGTDPCGGAVVIAGDDPAAKSSTIPSSSAGTLADKHIPVLYRGTPPTAAPPTTTVTTYADMCAREGGTQGYSAATGVRVCEIPDEILFRRDPADPVGFRQRCEQAGGTTERVGSGTRPCWLTGLSWFTPHEWDDEATERYTFDG